MARNGINPYTVVLSNESHTFPGDIDTALESMTICNIIAYDGASPLSVHIGEILGIPDGMTVEV